MNAKNIFCFLSIIILLLIVTYIHAIEEDDDYYDYGEKQVLMNSYDLRMDEKQPIYNDEVQKKIDFLKERGYSQVNRPTSFYIEDIYRMTYGSNIGQSEGYKETIFFKDGIGYILTYTRYKPNDPNFYVSVTFEVGGERYWFIKINYFLEYFRIEEWLNEETGTILVDNIFY